MNIQQLIVTYPSLNRCVERNGYPNLSEDVAIVEGLSIPNQSDLLVISTLWVDCVGDSISNICGMVNCRAIDQKETNQDTNMSTTLYLFERETPGEAVVLVHGQNGEYDGSWLLYKF
jgi:hypothetical protein